MTREDLEEFYEERAAIMHFEGGWPKEKAEALAKAEMESHMKSLERAELIAAGKHESTDCLRILRRGS